MPNIETPLATVEDVQRFYESPIPAADEPRVTGLLDAAEAKLLRMRQGLRSWIQDGSVDPDLVTWALVSAVLRVLRNPAGYASESVGDLSYRLSSAAATGLLTFTAEELAGCTPASRVAPAHIGSVRLAPPAYGVPGGYPDPWSGGSWR